jgi:hypothetical protein
MLQGGRPLHYSMTSSALASSPGGTSMPSACCLQVSAHCAGSHGQENPTILRLVRELAPRDDQGRGRTGAVSNQTVTRMPSKYRWQN